MYFDIGIHDIDLTIVENLRPVLEAENLGPARDAIHDMFLEHVMAHAPGYNKLMEWTDAPTGARGWLVLNSLRGGAAGGGTRMRKGLGPDEVTWLAKGMELKFAFSSKNTHSTMYSSDCLRPS